MSSNETINVRYDKTTEVRETKRTEEARNKCRKLWKTMDAPLADRDDNLYVAVRQSLHKVDQLPRGERMTSMGSSTTGGRGGVSQESSMGRFSAIKAFFDDQNVRQEGGSPFRCRSRTMMGKLMRMLELRKRETSSIGCSSDLIFSISFVSRFRRLAGISLVYCVVKFLEKGGRLSHV